LQVGEIEDIRLVTNYKGRSKGYAYVQFKDEVKVSVLVTVVICVMRTKCVCCIILEIGGGKLCGVKMYILCIHTCTTSATALPIFVCWVFFLEFSRLTFHSWNWHFTGWIPVLCLAVNIRARDVRSWR